jgi:hypothetical protein
VVESVRRVFLNALGLDAARASPLVVDELGLEWFTRDLLGTAMLPTRPPLLTTAEGAPVAPRDPEDLIRAYVLSGRLVVAAAASAGDSRALTDVDRVCSIWAADHLQAASGAASPAGEELVAVCPACIMVYGYEGGRAACPACGTDLVLKPVREPSVAPAPPANSAATETGAYPRG